MVCICKLLQHTFPVGTLGDPAPLRWRKYELFSALRTCAAPCCPIRVLGSLDQSVVSGADSPQIKHQNSWLSPFVPDNIAGVVQLLQASNLPHRALDARVRGVRGVFSLKRLGCPSQQLLSALIWYRSHRAEMKRRMRVRTTLSTNSPRVDHMQLR